MVCMSSACTFKSYGIQQFFPFQCHLTGFVLIKSFIIFSLALNPLTKWRDWIILYAITVKNWNLC